MLFENNLAFARQMDKSDPIASIRQEFAIPKQKNGKDEVYFCGNSLGLQPKLAAKYVQQELQQWASLGVKGHFSGDYPWMPYHEFLSPGFADLVGAKVSEVVSMNSLTANLHFMMVSFYRPNKTRHKILIEEHAFPSDHYAVESQIKFHGFSVRNSILFIKPREGESAIRDEDVVELIEQQGDSIALILLPGVQYYTGQVFDMKSITHAGHNKGCKVGFDLAHATGNILMQLHDWQVDFACWCTYKYLNSGPGSVAGCFVHEKHHHDKSLPRFTGWWGHDKNSRFKMENNFDPIASAEAWQLSNPPVLSLAAIRGALDTVKKAGGITALREKAIKLTGYLRYLIELVLVDEVEILTPSNVEASGSQLSLAIKIDPKDTIERGKDIFDTIEELGVTADWRYPNVIRVAPVAQYNSFEDVFLFAKILKKAIEKHSRTIE